MSEGNDYWKKVYEQAEPKAVKYLHSNGTIDENPGSGSSASLEDNHTVTITQNGTVIINPSTGKDAMKKVTATVNISASNEIYNYSTLYEGVGYYISTSKSSLAQLAVGDNVLYSSAGSYNYNTQAKVTDITEGVITITPEDEMYEAFTINADTTADSHFSI